MGMSYPGPSAAGMLLTSVQGRSLSPIPGLRDTCTSLCNVFTACPGKDIPILRLFRTAISPHTASARGG